MNRCILIIWIICNAGGVFGQALNGKISGIVTDSVSSAGLELATISIFAKDSSLISYQLTDVNGHFTIGKLPLHRDLRLDVSYTGYTTRKQYFRIDSAKTIDNFRIALSINLDDTNAIVINSIVPIRMNGDTLEINPAAFKMEKTAVAEELLNQVPGITIWADGTITVNGRPVPKILVDGKPFLNQADPVIATQNLPKNAIEKIQLYQEIDRTKEQRDNNQQDSIFTMNIKLKENKKTGYFGKGGVGYGTADRYEMDASFQAYNKRNSIAIGGGINNINKNIGSLEEMLSNNTFRNINPGRMNISNFGRNGITKSYSVGASATHNFVLSDNGSMVDNLSANYNNSGSNNSLIGKTIQERTTKDFSQYIENTNRSNSSNYSNSAGMSYSKSNNNSRNFYLAVNSVFSKDSYSSNNFATVKDSSLALQNTNETTSESKSTSRSGGMSINWNNFSTTNELSRFTLNTSINFSDNNSNRNARSIFDSYTDPAADTSYNRLYDNSRETMNFQASFNYNGLRRLLFRRFNLFGINLSLSQIVSFDQNRNNAGVNDYDSAAQKFMINNNLSNNNTLKTFRYTPGLLFQKTFNKWTPRYSRSFSINVRIAQSLRKETNISSFAVRNVTRSFSFFTPNINVNHHYGVRDKFMYNMSLGFIRNFAYPSVDQLYTIIDSINLYSIRFGNAGLKNTRTESMNVNFSINKRKPKAKFEMGTSVNGAIIYKANPIADSIVNDISGKRLLYYINANDGVDYNLNYSANLSRKIRKDNIQLQYSGSVGGGRTTNFIDNIESDNRRRNVSHNISLQYALKTLIILRLSEVISTYSSGQSGTGLSSYQVTNTSTQFTATINYSKNLSFNTTVSNTDNSNVANTFVLWHAFGTYRFLKSKQAEFKFSAFDILKKFRNISSNFNVDGTSTTITNGLQQYFLLTFSYYPRKFGKKNLDD